MQMFYYRRADCYLKVLFKALLSRQAAEEIPANHLCYYMLYMIDVVEMKLINRWMLNG